MMLKFGRIVVVSTAALALVAAAIPSRAEAFVDYPGGYGAAAYGAGGYGYAGEGYYRSGCGCQVYVPPPPPCCRVYAPPPCCAYGDGARGNYYGGYYGSGYGSGYGGYYGGGYRGYYGY